MVHHTIEVGLIAGTKKTLIHTKDMTKDQIDAYIKGYNDIKAEGSKPMTFIELHNEGLF
jgi:hypothetical protein